MACPAAYCLRAMRICSSVNLGFFTASSACLERTPGTSCSGSKRLQNSKVTSHTCWKLARPFVAAQAEGDCVNVLSAREAGYANDQWISYTTPWFDKWRFVDGWGDERPDPAIPPAPAAKIDKLAPARQSRR